MLFETNKEKGRAGLAMAIGYFGSHGYTVSIPLNDTQDYDLLVDKDGIISKISIKATGQRSSYGITIVSLTNNGGTKGSLYGRECEKNIDYVFVVNEEEEKWLLPKEILTLKTMNLGSQYDRYRLQG